MAENGALQILDFTTRARNAIKCSMHGSNHNNYFQKVNNKYTIFFKKMEFSTRAGKVVN